MLHWPTEKRRSERKDAHSHETNVFDIFFSWSFDKKYLEVAQKKSIQGPYSFPDQYFGTEWRLHFQTTQKKPSSYTRSPKNESILTIFCTEKLGKITWFGKLFTDPTKFDQRMTKNKPKPGLYDGEKCPKNVKNCALSQNFPPELRRKKTAIKLLTHHRFYLTTDINKRAIQTNQCTCSLCRCWHCWEIWNFSN